MKKLFVGLLLCNLSYAGISGGGSGTPEGTAVKSTGISSGLVLTANGANGASWTSVAGTGDVVGPAASVDSEIALFNSTTGKLLKRASGTGLCKAVSGVASFATLVDADVAAGAAITRSKLATGTANRVVIEDGSGNLSDSSVTAAQLALLAPSEFDSGNSGTAKTIDWTNGTAQKSTLTGNVTYTLSNPVTGTSYVLRIATGAGSFTVTWPAAVKWSGGSAPTITATASKVDLVNLYWDGTSYYGSFTQNY